MNDSQQMIDETIARVLAAQREMLNEDRQRTIAHDDAALQQSQRVIIVAAVINNYITMNDNDIDLAIKTADRIIEKMKKP